MNGPLHVGLDLGGTNIKAVVLEGLGESIQPTPIFRQTTPTEAEGGPQHVSDRLVKIVTEIKASIGEIETIGLGVPGLFDGDGGTIEFLPNLLGAWKGFQIVAATGSRMGTDPVLINDARAFALAEGTLGAGKDAAVMLGIVLGTGIGGGIMINGRLHTGAYGMAGEVGHQTVLPDGPICGCGNRGCMEALARGDVVAAAAGVADTKALYAASAAGDPRAIEAIKTAAGYIAIGILNAVVLLGVDVVVIGGGIGSAGDVVLDPIREAVYERVTLASKDQIRIVQAALGPEAGAIGAALTAVSQRP